VQAVSNQRMSRRHIPKQTLLAVSAWPNSELGVVRDIGMGGFSLECTCDDLRPGMEMVFDIFVSGRPDRVLLRQLPCRLVYDYHRRDALHLGLTSPLKTFGFHFIGLSPEQRSDLRSFLDRQTSSPGPAHPAPASKSVMSC
jgi:hypothetical protein